MGTTHSDQGTVDTEPLTFLHWLGITAALATAAVHLLLGVRMLPSGLGISFVLAGAGFLGAVWLVLQDYRRLTVYLAGIPFTAVQVVLWYYLNFAAGDKQFPADVGTLGVVDKTAQLTLILVLVRLLVEDQL